MPIDANVIFYGLVYLIDNTKYDEALRYIKENYNDLLEELDNNEDYLKLLEYLIKARSNYAFNADNIKDIYNYINTTNFINFQYNDDRYLAFCVLVYIIAVKFIDLDKDDSIDPDAIKALVELEKELIVPLKEIYTPFVKTLKIWHVLSAEDKADAKDRYYREVKRVVMNGMDNSNIRVHFTK